MGKPGHNLPKSITNSCEFVGHVGCVGPVGLLRGFVSLKFKNPQTHIFKLHGLGTGNLRTLPGTLGP